MHLPFKYLCNTCSIQVPLQCIYNLSTFVMHLPFKYLCSASTIQVPLQCIYHSSTFAIHLPFKCLNLQCMLHSLHLQYIYYSSTFAMHLLFKYLCNMSTIQVLLLCIYHMGTLIGNACPIQVPLQCMHI